ncbi:phospholipase-like protein [Tanacetum coccineum]
MDLNNYEVPRILVTCRSRLGRQMELLSDETDIVPFYYHIVDNFQIQFGREKFCLVTGLRQNSEKLIKSQLFYRLNDDDAVSLCCVGILQFVLLGRQMEVLDDETDIVSLYYHIVDNFQIQFRREEFCLVTGLRFGVEYWADYDNDDEPIPFSLYCVGILQLVLLGLEDRRRVPDWILRLENDRDGWDKYPWGSYIWPTLYSQLKDANVRRWPSLYDNEPRRDVDKKMYSIFGFTWAFKTWILESFRVGANTYYKRHRRYLRVVAWSSKGRVFRLRFGHRETALSFKIPSSSATPFGQPHMPSHPGTSNWQSQMPSYSSTPNLQTPISSHPHDASLLNLNILNRERREHRPSIYRRTPYMDLPPTTVLPKKRGDKTRNKVKNANLSPLNLGNAFAEDNVGGDDVMFLGQHYTGNYLVYDNVDPSKVWRQEYVDCMDFLLDPYDIYLDCYMKGYLVPANFWRQLVPYLCMSGVHSLESEKHMNSWMELLIRERPQNARWTVAKSGTVCVHPENQRFIIQTDQHIIGTLDGSTHLYPAWSDVDWVYMPIHVAGNHWVTGAVHLPNSLFYVFDSMLSESVRY